MSIFRKKILRYVKGYANIIASDCKTAQKVGQQKKTHCFCGIEK